MGKVLQLLWPLLAVFVRMVSKELYDEYERKRRLKKQVNEAAKKLREKAKEKKQEPTCPARKLPRNPYDTAT